MIKKTIIKKVILFESIGFWITILLLWANELFDLPHKLFGTIATPINWIEIFVENIFVLILYVVVIYFSSRFLKRIKYLEGFISMCSFCKRIKVNNSWMSVDEYIKTKSDADITHGLCPECARKHYKEFL